MITSSEATLAGRTVLVAGGTGNVGRHIVRRLLRDGATVIVPSRTQPKLEALRAAAGGAADRLVTLAGDVADERDAERLRDEISRRAAPLDAVVASLGRYTVAPSLLAARRAELLEVLENYVIAHFVVARTFIPVVAARGGSYTMINGPSAFGTWSGSGLVSIATAAQSMLAQALADENEAGNGARIAQLVIHPSAWIGPDDAPGGGPIDGEAVGRYVSAIIAGRVGGRATLHLESPEQLAAAG